MAEGVVVGARLAQGPQVVGDARQTGAGTLILRRALQVVLAGVAVGLRGEVDRRVAEGLLDETQAGQGHPCGVDLPELQAVEGLIGGGVDPIVGFGAVLGGVIVHQERATAFAQRETRGFLLGPETQFHLLEGLDALGQTAQRAQRAGLLELPDERVLGVVLGGGAGEVGHDGVITGLAGDTGPLAFLRVRGAADERGGEDGEEQSQARETQTGRRRPACKGDSARRRHRGRARRHRAIGG